MSILEKLAVRCSFLSGFGSEAVEDAPPNNLNSIKKTSRIVATEICHEDLNQSPSNRNGSVTLHVRTMRRVVKELSSRHEIVFDKFVKSIAETSQYGVDRIDEGLERVVTDMFKDGQINWGRVVAVYAFAQRLAHYCVLQNMPNMVEKISDVTANFVENNLSEWILNQGGWDSFEKQFQEEESTESKMWTGLLCTFIGLGTLATITALK